MKAWVFYGFGDIRLDEVPDPVLREGWVLVKIEVFQPSVTEVMRIKGSGVEGLEKVKKNLETKGPTQMFGHEFSGRIIETSKTVSFLKIGDRVALRTVRGPCGLCEACVAGHASDCLDQQWLSIDYPGCFAEYVAVPETIIRKVPDVLTPHEAAVMQPLSSVISSVDHAGIKMGEVVTVLGLGVLGLYATQFIRLQGASKIIASDVNAANLKLAGEIGVDVIIDANKENPVEVVRRETKGLGSDVTFECAGGNPAQGLSGGKTLVQAVDMARKGGKIVQMAHVMPGNTVPFEFKTLRKQGIFYMGHLGATDAHFNYGIKMVTEKKVNVAKMITHTLDGIDKLPQALEITGNKSKYHSINPAQVIVWKN
jgi:threonine dehydrogenase-like Zn-dependent dehydrogenase